MSMSSGIPAPAILRENRRNALITSLSATKSTLKAKSPVATRATRLKTVMYSKKINTPSPSLAVIGASQAAQATLVAMGAGGCQTFSLLQCCLLLAMFSRVVSHP